MSAAPTVAVTGEVVADAVMGPHDTAGATINLTVHAGGGPANTAITLARLGTHTRFAGRISGGALGQLCRAKLLESGVDLSASETATEPATLAIAQIDRQGAARYEFYTDGTADWAWTDRTLAPLIDGPFGPFAAPAAVHTGSLALALQPSGGVIERLLGRARETMTVSIDPNLRTLLVPVEKYRAAIDQWAALADIIRLSQDDLQQLWPDHTPEQAAEHLHQQGVSLAVISLGAHGAFASLRGETAHIPISPTVLVDTVGAGDSFHGGLLHHLAGIGALGGRLESLGRQQLVDALEFASRVAAITCSRPGADPPWATELAES